MPIERGGIVNVEKKIEQPGKGDDRGIELDLYDLGMSCRVGADLFISRVPDRAARISGGGQTTPSSLAKASSTPQKQPAPKSTVSVCAGGFFLLKVKDAEFMQ